MKSDGPDDRDDDQEDGVEGQSQFASLSLCLCKSSWFVFMPLTDGFWIVGMKHTNHPVSEIKSLRKKLRICFFFPKFKSKILMLQN